MEETPLLAAYQPAALVYSISSDLRRSCWYVLGSLPIGAAIVIWQLPQIPNPQPARLVPLAIFLGAFGTFLLGSSVLPLFWRLRIDEVGISRRRMFRFCRWCAEPRFPG